MLQLPDRAGNGVAGDALGIAVAIGVDARRAVLDHRIVSRDRSVEIEAHDRAQMVLGVLGFLLVIAAFAQGQEQRPVRVEQDASAKVEPARLLEIDVEDVFNIVERGEVFTEGRAGEGGVVRLRRAFGIAEIDHAAVGEIGRQRDVQQTALTFHQQVIRQARNRGFAKPVRIDDAQSALALGDQHLARRQEGDGPGVFQPARDGFDDEIGLFGLNDVLGEGGGGQSHEAQAGDGGGTDHSGLPVNGLPGR